MIGEHEFCPRCKCCDQTWHECHDCLDGAIFRSACIDDLCHGNEECIHGDDAQLPCDTCEDKGGWLVCGGGCCSHGKHEQVEGCDERCKSWRMVEDDY